MEWWQILLIVLGGLLLLLALSIVLYKPFFKRFWDVVFSFLALMVFSPLFLTLTVVGAIAMRGNPFFLQKRPGKINKKTGKETIFWLIKFRTMSNKMDGSGNLLPDDERLTKYGAFLRSTSLDEFPEALNIIAGHMSIIGPRPQLVRDMVFMSEEQRKRHSVRPGLSGLAQVNGRNGIPWDKKFEYDLQYLKRYNLFYDFALIVKTIIKAFAKRDGIVREGTSSDLDFGDWLLKENRISADYYNKMIEKAKGIINEN